MHIGTILGIISKAKSKGENEHKYKELHGHEFKCKDIAVIFMAYEKELKIQNVVVGRNILYTVGTCSNIWDRIMTTCY